MSSGIFWSLFFPLKTVITMIYNIQSSLPFRRGERGWGINSHRSSLHLFSPFHANMLCFSAPGGTLHIGYNRKSAPWVCAIWPSWKERTASQAWQYIPGCLGFFMGEDFPLKMSWRDKKNCHCYVQRVPNNQNENGLHCILFLRLVLHWF